MTAEEHKEWTHDHRELREQIEARQRKQRNAILLSVLTALGSGGGVGAYGYMNAAGDDDVRTELATHVAKFETWQKATVEDLRMLQAQNIELLQAVAGMKATLEAGRHTARPVHIELPAAYTGSIRASRRIVVPPEMIQRKRIELFEDDD